MNIICMPSTSWRGLWQRHQHIMSRMRIRGHNVVYLEPINILEHIRAPSGRRVERLEDGTVLVRPVFLPLHHRSELIRRFDGWRTGRLLRRAMKDEGGIEVVWTALPYYNPILPYLPHKVLVYDCIDAVEGFLPDQRQKAWALRAEEALIAQADKVFAVSPGLQARCERAGALVELAPNGVPDHFFVQQSAAEELSGFPRPIVGFVGGLESWLDYDLIVELARARPNWSIVMVGPVDARVGEVEKLKRVQNIHLLGRRPYSDVPGLITGFDVCIVPFKVNDLTNLSNPIKILEYLACGRPVVCTPIAAARPFDDVVSIVERADFVAAVENALIDENERKRAIRRSRVRESGWDALVERLERQLEGLLKD